MRTLTYILSFAIGFSLAFLFFKGRVTKEIVIKKEERIDTLYTHEVDTIWIPYETLIETIDTVYYSEPFKADISRYKGSEVVNYGNIDWSLETTGKLTNLRIIPNLTIPTITKEIETVKTVTTVRDLRGLYAGAGINQNLGYKVGASYVDRDWQFNYDYEVKNAVHWVGVRKRIF